MEKEKLFEVKDLRISAKNDDGEEVKIVKGVTFDIHKGEVVALIGDGGIQFTLSELATAVELGLPVLLSDLGAPAARAASRSLTTFQMAASTSWGVRALMGRPWTVWLKALENVWARGSWA